VSRYEGVLRHGAISDKWIIMPGILTAAWVDGGHRGVRKGITKRPVRGSKRGK